jgi:hypothetical protein
MTEKECEGIFTTAGIPFTHKWELMNQYWPRAYPDMILNSPWWLVETPMGLIRIGWRKRVIEIDWSHTRFEHKVTTDSVTISNTSVHAWEMPKAAEYLKNLYTAWLSLPSQRKCAVDGCTQHASCELAVEGEWFPVCTTHSTNVLMPRRQLQLQ